MWWDSKVAGVAVVQECPNGAVGEAVRNCTGQGDWEEPDLLNCTSQEFLELESQVNRSAFQSIRKDGVMTLWSLIEMVLARQFRYSSDERHNTFLRRFKRNHHPHV